MRTPLPILPVLGACEGQQELEEHFALALSRAKDDGLVDPGPAGVRLGRSCLHLDLRPDPILFSHLLAVMVPVLEVPPEGAPDVSGVVGLRVASADVDRFVLRRWDGHGCLVLHTDQEGAEMWDEWKVSKPWEDWAGEGAEHGFTFEPLWEREGLCDREVEALLCRTFSEAASSSQTLRQGLAEALPEDPRLTHQPQRVDVQPRTLSRATIPAPRSSGAVELSPAALVPLEGPVSPSVLGDALAWQLIELLRAGRIRAGDVLIDHVALVTKIGGREAAARWAQLVIEHVAKRYGLLRYRRRRPGDPAGRRVQDHVWAVSEGASAMAGIASAELGLDGGRGAERAAAAPGDRYGSSRSGEVAHQ
ncbi:hypothetical protein [Streptomyces sp. NPDC056056]|uniref:hypothetical protein n=1 Tax=Streptomyces sp. NPDC056056 TaxID=3345698 RepID=UPI0035D62BBD